MRRRTIWLEALLLVFSGLMLALAAASDELTGVTVTPSPGAAAELVRALGENASGKVEKGGKESGEQKDDKKDKGGDGKGKEGTGAGRDGGESGISTGEGGSKDNEETPNNYPDKFKPVHGTPAKEHKETGEVFVRDKSRHGGDHYEVYRNRRDYDKGLRDRSVSMNGRVIRRYR